MEKKNNNPTAPQATNPDKNTRPLYVLIAAMLIAVLAVMPLRDALSTSIHADAATETYLMGDVDLNGQIEPSDARTVLRVSVKLEELEGVKDCAVLPNSKSEPTKGQLADIDGDGQITPADARAVLRMSVMLEEQKTIEVTIEEPSTEPTSGDVEPTTNKNGLTKAQQDELDEILNQLTGAAKEEANKNLQIMLDRKMPFDNIKTTLQSIVDTFLKTPVSESTTEKKTGLTEKEIQELRDYAHTLLGYQQENDSRRDKVIETDIQACIKKGMTYEEIKQQLTTWAKEIELPPEETEPVTYQIHDENGTMYCKWCGKEVFEYPDGTRSCYHVSWPTDHVCPGCKETIKARTCHDCKAYFDYLSRNT